MIAPELKCIGPDTPVHPSTFIQEQMRQDVMMARMAAHMAERAAKVKAALEAINHDQV